MARGNLDYDQIRDACRQGDGTKFQTFGGSSADGHVPIFDSAGKLIDSGRTVDTIGNAAGGRGNVVSPVSDDWSLVNDGGSTIDWSAGAGYLSVVSGSYLRGIKMTAPATPYSAIALIDHLAEANGNYLAIGFCDGSSPVRTSVLFMGISDSANFAVTLEHASVTAWSSEVAVLTGARASEWTSRRPVWLKWRDDGTNLTWYASFDKTHWEQFFAANTVARNAYMPSGPNGIFIGRCTKNGAGRVNLISFETQ